MKIPKMINNKTVLLLSLLSLFLLINPLFAWDKKKAIQRIHKAKTMINDFDDNPKLAPYIPFKEYSDAFINLIIAQNELNKGNYKLAYYYSRIAIIQLETIVIIANTRKYSYKYLRAERDYYKSKSQTKTKKHVTKEVSTGALAIVKARLFKKAGVFRRVIIDKRLFFRRTFKLTVAGKTELNNIIDVMTLFPKAHILVIGHSSYSDYKNYSRYKASAIARYLRDNGIPSERITFYGLGNSEVMDTPVGYRRINRIEIIITGISL